MAEPASSQRRVDSRAQVFVATTAGDFTEQIDVTHGGREREVEPTLNRLRVQNKRQSGGSPTQVRLTRGKRPRRAGGQTRECQ